MDNTMETILQKTEKVKQKLQIAGEEPRCSLCVDDFHIEQPMAGSPALNSTNFPFGANIDAKGGSLYQSCNENLNEGKCGLPIGQDNAIGSKKVEVGGVGGGGSTTLLDTIEISGHLNVSEETNRFNFERYVDKREVCNTKVRIMNCRHCGFRYIALLGCGLRTCPECAADFSRKVYWQVLDVMKHIQKKKYYTLKLITFSYGIDSDISEAIKKVKKVFKKIWHNKLERKGSGAVVTVELGEKNLSIHLHVLYYGPYLPRPELIKEWKRLTGKWYVDIRMARGNKAIKEVIKYIGKAIMNMDYETAYKIEMSIKGTRRLMTYGVFYKRVKEKRIVCPNCGNDSWLFCGIEEATVPIVEEMLIQRQFFEKQSE